VIKQAHHAVRIAQSMLAGHHVTTVANLIMPAFVAGETLARPGGPIAGVTAFSPPRLSRQSATPDRSGQT
jgi:hypothetical protein